MSTSYVIHTSGVVAMPSHRKSGLLTYIDITIRFQIGIWRCDYTSVKAALTTIYKHLHWRQRLPWLPSIITWQSVAVLVSHYILCIVLIMHVEVQSCLLINFQY